MTVDPHVLAQQIAALASERLPDGVSGVTVEPKAVADGGDILIVTIKLATADVDDDALEALLETIESEVARQDERYPSVRFQEAA